MKKYLVGGAVRDELLGREVHDRDYVITGATIAQMLEAGYQQVGADFPVFLHPQTKDEHALARTERKSGFGYKGFTVDFNAQVTLEEDLERRDLTINAIAKDEQGNYVDPFNGRVDLENRIIRHVSEAFAEDPLRVLRVARFAAQLKHLGFSVHPDTIALMQTLAESGELLHLTVERVFKEMEKALCSHSPNVFFEVLKDAQAYPVLFADLTSGDFTQAMEILTAASKVTELPEVRWAAALTALLSQEQRLSGAVNDVSEKLKVPNRYAVLASKVVELSGQMEALLPFKPDYALNLLTKLDALRRPDLVEQFILSCEAIARSTQPAMDDYPQGMVLRQACEAVNRVTAKAYVEQGFKGKQIKQQMDLERLRMLAQIQLSAKTV